MKNYLSVFISGILFGMGLAISGMINPQKVADFLDITGTFDPTLLFVMGGAISITMPGFYYLAKRRSAPLFSSIFYLPLKQDLDLPLITGAVIFGIGWGLSGYCPGPAITSLVSLKLEPLIFVVALVIGQTLAKLTVKKG